MSLIVVEGLDGSGKGTQSELLFKFLAQGDYQTVRKITFPDYNSPSSALVKMYLAGDFGTDADSVNPFAASSFYAVDRYASYHTSWKKDYQNGNLILADRYTTSNIVYQLSKMDKNLWDEFISWVEDYEYNKLKLPKPDLVIYLDMPPMVSQSLLSGRYNGDEDKKDIHEKNVDFLLRCRESAHFAAEKLDWKLVNCAENNAPRKIEDIHEEIKALVIKSL